MNQRMSALKSVPNDYVEVMKQLFNHMNPESLNDILQKADRCIRQPGNASMLRLLHSMPRGGFLLGKANGYLACLQRCKEFSELTTRTTGDLLTSSMPKNEIILMTAESIASYLAGDTFASAKHHINCCIRIGKAYDNLVSAKAAGDKGKKINEWQDDRAFLDAIQDWKTGACMDNFNTGITNCMPCFLDIFVPQFLFGGVIDAFNGLSLESIWAADSWHHQKSY